MTWTSQSYLSLHSFFWYWYVFFFLDFCFFIVFRLWLRPLLLQCTPVNFHFFLIVAPAKRFHLLLGTLDKSVGGVSNAEHQRAVAWAGAVVTVIPCEGYIHTKTPSGVAGSLSRFKRNWYNFKQHYILVSTIYLFLKDQSKSPEVFILFSLFLSSEKSPPVQKNMLCLECREQLRTQKNIQGHFLQKS